MNIFEQASKQALRFTTTQGFLQTEDLWNIKIKDLDGLAMDYKKMIEESSQDSFLSNPKTKDTDLQLQFDICKSIILTRVADLDKAEKADYRRKKNHKIMALIAMKEDDELKESSKEELLAMLKEEG